METFTEYFERYYNSLKPKIDLARLSMENIYTTHEDIEEFDKELKSIILEIVSNYVYMGTKDRK